MLKNTIISLVRAGICEIHILSKGEICYNKLISFLFNRESYKQRIYNGKLKIIIDNSELNDAINKYIHSFNNKNILIIMSDLPLINKNVVLELLEECKKNSVIVPSHSGGTNILFLKDGSNFNVQYHGNSFIKHRNEAIKKNIKLKIYSSEILSIDLDTKEDILKTYESKKINELLELNQ